MSEPKPRVVWREVSGIITLDKPIGMSSNTALQRVRRAYRAHKAGHTGSLDPLASGHLPICLGEATKVAGYLLEESKTYEAVVSFGQRTDTGDLEGTVVETAPVPALTDAQIDETLDAHMGLQWQTPPMYSALKHQGQPLYRLARQGVEIEREARQIEILRLKRLWYRHPELAFEVHCSKGTYVRTLAEDIAKAFSTVGHLTHLRRSGIGSHQGWVAYRLDEIENASLEQLDAWLKPTEAGVAHWPTVRLTPTEGQALRQGKPQAVALDPNTRYQLWAGPVFLGLGLTDELGTTLRSLRLMAGGDLGG